MTQEVHTALAEADKFALAILPWVTLWFVISGFDDVCVDLIYGFMKFFGAVNPEPERDALYEKRLAIFVPLWQEHQVIERMLEHNLSIIQYSNYEFFIGVYPNDHQTLRAVRRAAAKMPRIHLCLCPHDGPTSKADCLNWILQHMVLHEQRTGDEFDAIVTHDAEDVIHPYSFRKMNNLLSDYDMVQIPVLPLATRFRALTHAVYCDEFAEGQLKDLRARAFAGGFLPACGVGTALSRNCVRFLSEEYSNQVFDPSCLTEDYEIGMRVHRLGLKQIFAEVGWQLTATREFFPQTFRGAVRQRTRWITGIALQGWHRNGWGRDWKSWYWLWRDRKGLIGNPLSLPANLLFVYGAITSIVASTTGTKWGLSSGSIQLALLALLFQVIRLCTRTACSALIYGKKFAAGTLLRVLWANAINFCATLAAVQRFTVAVFTKTPLVWLKTEHAFPSVSVLEKAAAMVEQKASSVGAK